MEFGVEERERLLASVVDFGLDEANIEETDISDEAADYYQNDFYEINDLENQEESKIDIDKLLKMCQNLNKNRDKYLLSFLNQENI